MVVPGPVWVGWHLGRWVIAHRCCPLVEGLRECLRGLAVRGIPTGDRASAPLSAFQ